MLKKLLLIVIGIVIGFFLFTPEEGRLETALYTKIEGVPPGMSKFLIETKTGRKISYFLVKKKTKSEMRKLRKEAEDYMKELGVK